MELDELRSVLQEARGVQDLKNPEMDGASLTTTFEFTIRGQKHFILWNKYESRLSTNCLTIPFYNAELSEHGPGENIVFYNDEDEIICVARTAERENEEEV